MTINVATLSKNLAGYLDTAAKAKSVIDVETETGNVVIVSAAEFEKFREEIETAQALARADADYAAGRIISHEEMIAIMDAKIAEAKARLGECTK